MSIIVDQLAKWQPMKSDECDMIQHNLFIYLLTLFNCTDFKLVLILRKLPGIEKPFSLQK